MYTALLTAVVTWISANFELPPNYNHPSIKLVPAVEITFWRYKAFTLAEQRELLSLQIEGTAHSTRREAVAVYDDLTKTIFLPHSWKGETPADLSVLVHEMVHHLQNKRSKVRMRGRPRRAGVCRARQMAQAVWSRPLIRIPD
jgi:hypothetical protein